MKRAKSMLMIILVLSISGGILAFNAARIGNTNYCYLVTERLPDIGECTYTAVLRSARAWTPNDPVIYYTTTQVASSEWCKNAHCVLIGIPDQQ
jgi:hypothetical protein